MPQAKLSRREALGAMAAPLLAKDEPRPNFMFIPIDDLRFSRGASSDAFRRALHIRARQVGLYATMYKAMGIDWRMEYMSPIGRP